MNDDLLDVIMEALKGAKATASANLQTIGTQAKQGAPLDDVARAAKEALAPVEKLAALERKLTADRKAQEQAYRNTLKAQEQEARKAQRVMSGAEAQRVRDAQIASKALTGIGQQKTRDAIKQATEEAKSVGLGRLPLASVGAGLRGNISAGSRLGRAVGEMGGSGFTGLGVGALAAGAVKSGFAASPIGTDVITKPLQILAATIGILVLPSIVKFGVVLLDWADWLDKKINDKEQTQKDIDENGTDSFFGAILKPFNYLKAANDRDSANGQGGALDDIIQENNRRRAAGQAPLSPEEQTARKKAMGIEVGDAAIGEKPKSNRNANMLIKAMQEGIGGGVTPKIGTNLEDIAKETQMQSFMSELDQRLIKPILEALGQVQTELKR